MKQLAESKVLSDTEGYDGWVLIHSRENKGENLPILDPVYESHGSFVKTPTPSVEDIFGGSASRSALGKAKRGMFYRQTTLINRFLGFPLLTFAFTG